MNCLTMAIYAWVRGGFRGRISARRCGFIYHFVVLYGGDRYLHWFSEKDPLRWWEIPHHRGRYRRGSGWSKLTLRKVREGDTLAGNPCGIDPMTHAGLSSGRVGLGTTKVA